MMVMRIATFDERPVVDPALYEQFRAWMASQPGNRALYHVHDPESGRYLSVSVWDSREALFAMKDRQFPGGKLGLKPSSMVIYEIDTAHTTP